MKGSLFSKKSKKPKIYVDNEKFFDCIVDYLNEYKKYESGLIDKKPRIPEYVGEAIYKIAENLSKLPKFYNYPFKDDLISNAIQNCLEYIKSFNPKKSQNPFSYFTRVIYFSFIQTIKKEKKILYLKNKIILEFDIKDYIDDLNENSSILESEFRTKLNDYYKNHGEYLQNEN